jgi:hypothetical protein
MRILPCLGLAVTLGFGCGSSPSSGVELTDDGIDDAKADAPVTASALTSAESHTILDLIDDACGDAWCEGDYNYAFKRFTCKTTTHSCTLTVIVIDEGDPAAHTATRSFWRSCKIPGFSGFDGIVETAANGYQGLTDGYFDKLNDCMEAIDGSVPAR